MQQKPSKSVEDLTESCKYIFKCENLSTCVNSDYVDLTDTMLALRQSKINIKKIECTHG